MSKEIEELKRKVEEFKNKYELAKQKRIELVDTIKELDTKLENIETELKESTELKKEFLNAIKKILSVLGVGIIIFVITNLILNSFNSLPFQIIYLILINIPIYLVTVIIKKKKYSSKKIRFNLKKLQKEYEETEERRITEGSKYKKIKEEEDIAYKIYKATSELLPQEKEDNKKGQIYHINQLI